MANSYQSNSQSDSAVKECQRHQLLVIASAVPAMSGIVFSHESNASTSMHNEQGRGSLYTQKSV